MLLLVLSGRTWSARAKDAVDARPKNALDSMWKPPARFHAAVARPFPMELKPKHNRAEKDRLCLLRFASASPLPRDTLSHPFAAWSRASTREALNVDSGTYDITRNDELHRAIMGGE